MISKFKTIIAILVALVALSSLSSVEAATLSFTPASFEIGAGEKMTTELRIDSEGVSFNAAQATIRFPKDILEVVALDKTTSAFSFWLEEPQFSNTDGVISFTGGTPHGVSGGAVEILKVEFRAKGSGSGTLLLSDAAISASDGSGTNILSKTADATFSVLVSRGISPPPSPVPIIRQAIPAAKLPAKPILRVSLYPEEDRWYNLVSQFTANWNLPLDISGVSTALSQSPNSVPPAWSEGLFDSKTFPALSGGQWYLHARFQNNIGWGPTAHYKIAVDTKPPLGFEINILEGEKTDNPGPTLQFRTSDALSGLKEYLVRIGGNDPIQISATDFSGSFKLPLQAPGKREVLVRAIDRAENSVEDSVNLEILPITFPTITFVTKELFSDEERDLTIKGTALPDVNVLLKVQNVLRDGRGIIAATGTAHPDDKGNWEFTFNEPLRNGLYVVLAESQDARGALSLTVESSEIRVKSKPIIQIGAFQLGLGGAVLFLLLVLVGGFGGGVWFYRKRQGRLALRVKFTESEITKIFKLITEDVEGLAKSLETSTTGDDEYALKRLRGNITKMEIYLKRGVEKIKDRSIIG